MSVVHASCVVAGTAGVLIRGPSGAGKSTVALALIDKCRSDGRFAALVSDDRVILAETNARIIASAPSSIAGLVEQRGRGIRNLPNLPSAVVRLIVDLLPEAEVERMPEPEALVSRLNDIAIALQPVPERNVVLALPLIETALRNLDMKSGSFFM